MNTHRYPGQIVWKSFLVVLLATLAFQSLGMSSFAAIDHLPAVEQVHTR